MKKSIRKIIQETEAILTRAWDWPFVSGFIFDDADRDRFKGMSQYFAFMFAIAASGLSIVASLPIWLNITLSVLGVIIGHYSAGALLKLKK